MKTLFVMISCLFAFAAYAGNTTGVYIAKTTDEAEIASIVEGINKDRIKVNGCDRNQKVYRIEIKKNEGVFVSTSNGGFRPAGGKTYFYVSCSE